MIRPRQAYLVAPGVEALCSILRPIYRVPERPWKHGKFVLDGWDTVTAGTGISTSALASYFRAGDTVGSIAAAFRRNPTEIEAALRWEMLSRRVRVARVRRAVLGLP